MRACLVVLFSIIACVSAPAWAVTVHDEAISGDLGERGVFRPIDFGTLTADENAFLGSLDGGAIGDTDGPDEFDAFAFDVELETIINVEVLSTQGAALTVFLFSIGEEGVAQSFRAATIDPGQTAQAVFGVMEAGRYEVSLAPETNSDVLMYGLVVAVTVVPAPPSVWLMGSVLCLAVGASFYRRRRAV